MEENKVAQITDQELRTRAEVLALRDYAHYGAQVDAIFRELVAVRDATIKDVSGEQAEERTAREGRAETWLNERAIPLEWPYYTNKQYQTLKLAEALSRFAESECSRLASRVEELEKLLAEWVELQDECDAYPTSDGHPVYSSRKLLAGAHAEEKGK